MQKLFYKCLEHDFPHKCLEHDFPHKLCKWTNFGSYYSLTVCSFLISEETSYSLPSKTYYAGFVDYFGADMFTLQILNKYSRDEINYRNYTDSI